jgi:hypothetical protein
LPQSATTRAHKEHIRDIINNIKRGGCSICGYSSYLGALELHHTGDKDFQINKAHRKSVTKVLNEASKCVVVCANCHREIHAGMVGSLRDYRRAYTPPPVCELPLFRIVSNGS